MRNVLLNFCFLLFTLQAVQSQKEQYLIKNFEEYRLSKLDTVIYGMAGKIIHHNNEIFISQINPTGLYIFDKNYELKKIINKKGKGPGEISFSIQNISKYKDTLYIQDGPKIHKFDKNYKYISSEIIKTRIGDFDISKDGFFFSAMTNVSKNQDSILIGGEISSKGVKEFNIPAKSINLEAGIKVFKLKNYDKLLLFYEPKERKIISMNKSGKPIASSSLLNRKSFFKEIALLESGNYLVFWQKYYSNYYEIFIELLDKSFQKLSEIKLIKLTNDIGYGLDLVNDNTLYFKPLLRFKMSKSKVTVDKNQDFCLYAIKLNINEIEKKALLKKSNN